MKNDIENYTQTKALICKVGQKVRNFSLFSPAQHVLNVQLSISDVG